MKTNGERHAVPFPMRFCLKCSEEDRMDLNKSNVKKILLLITFAVLLLVGAMHPEIVFDILQSGLALL